MKERQKDREEKRDRKTERIRVIERERERRRGGHREELSGVYIRKRTFFKIKSTFSTKSYILKRQLFPY